MPSKSFTVGAPVGAEPITFDLVGTDTSGKPIKPITFRCKPGLQGVVLKNILGNVEDRIAIGVALIDLIPLSVVPEQLELYEQIINSNEIIVDATVLADIGGYLFETYNQNPTSAQSPSTPGSPPTGHTSMADYLNDPEPTLRPSPPIVYATSPTQ